MLQWVLQLCARVKSLHKILAPFHLLLNVSDPVLLSFSLSVKSYAFHLAGSQQNEANHYLKSHRFFCSAYMHLKVPEYFWKISGSFCMGVHDLLLVCGLCILLISVCSLMLCWEDEFSAGLRSLFSAASLAFRTTLVYHTFLYIFISSHLTSFHLISCRLDTALHNVFYAMSSNT